MRAEIDRLRQEVGSLTQRLEEANDQRVADADRHQIEVERLESTLRRLRAELDDARRPWLTKLWRK